MPERDIQHGPFGVSDSSTFDKPVRFPGETYSIVQFKAWHRAFQGRMAKKGLLKVLMRGVTDHDEESTEAERHRANRKA